MKELFEVVLVGLILQVVQQTILTLILQVKNLIKYTQIKLLLMV